MCRVRGEGATGGAFVRAWPTFNGVSGTPNNGYRVTIADRRSDVTTQSPDIPTSQDAPAWRHFEIECVGRTLVVRLDGSRVYASQEVENPQGYVALWASSGTLEFKAIEIRQHPVPTWEAPAGVLTKQDGVVFPRVRRDVKARYTAEALAAKIAGRVLVTAVVLPDGSVGEVLVRRSLDPKYGLDREAVAAAKQWRFVPGIRNGQPVAVLVSIELTFTLK
jgi:TonB family protein